jgi:hypothetical protein
MAYMLVKELVRLLQEHSQEAVLIIEFELETSLTGADDDELRLRISTVVNRAVVDYHADSDEVILEFKLDEGR